MFGGTIFKDERTKNSREYRTLWGFDASLDYVERIRLRFSFGRISNKYARNT